MYFPRNYTMNMYALAEDILQIRSGIDITIGEEPHLALMLLLNTNTGQFFARVWNRTIVTGRVVRKVDFSEVTIS